MSAPCLPVRQMNKKRKRTNNSTEEELSHDATQLPPSFDDIDTIDATEYLSRVVNQAKSMPDIFVASVQPKEFVGENSNHSVSIPRRLRNHVPIDGSAASLAYLISGRASITPPPSQDYLPQNPQWIHTTIENFQKLHDYLLECRSNGIGGKKTNRVDVPPMKDRAGWHIFCLGRQEARGNTNSYFGEDSDKDDDGEIDDGEIDDSGAHDEKPKGEEVVDSPTWMAAVPPSGHSPSVRILAQLDQVLVRRVLSHLIHFTHHGWSMSSQRSMWIYALLARLEKPVHRDDASSLFGLLKVLTLARSKASVDGDRTHLSHLNTLILLVGVYFEQGGKAVMSLPQTEGSKE